MRYTRIKGWRWGRKIAKRSRARGGPIRRLGEGRADHHRGRGGRMLSGGECGWMGPGGLPGVLLGDPGRSHDAIFCGRIMRPKRSQNKTSKGRILGIDKNKMFNESGKQRKFFSCFGIYVTRSGIQMEGSFLFPGMAMRITPMMLLISILIMEQIRFMMTGMGTTDLKEDNNATHG